MDVIAEGAEADSDSSELYQMGCEYAQGFVFGEPMEPDRAISLVGHSQAEVPRHVEAR